MTDRLTACLAFTLAREGGWSDNPKDPGGATMKGITLNVFRAWRHDSMANKAQLRIISDAETAAIYGANYWQPCRCQDLPTGLDLMVFDMAVNAGVRRSAILLQQAIGLADPDGWIGPATLGAAKRTGGLVGKLGAAQAAFYRSLPTFETFGKGWLARVDARTAAASGTAPRSVFAPVLASEADALNGAELGRVRRKEVEGRNLCLSRHHSSAVHDKLRMGNICDNGTSRESVRLLRSEVRRDHRISSDQDTACRRHDGAHTACNRCRRLRRRAPVRFGEQCASRIRRSPRICSAPEQLRPPCLCHPP